MAITLKYELLYAQNVSNVTNDAPDLVDVAVGDNTTYYQKTNTGADSGITAIYDLESATQIGRIRYRFGFASVVTITIQASNDGTTWTNARTGPPPGYFNKDGTFSWENEVNFTSVVSTAYRYWRLSINDTVDSSQNTDVRVGDFRLFDTNGVQINPEFGVIVRRRSYPGPI